MICTSGDEARRLAVGKLAVGAEHVIMKLAAGKEIAPPVVVDN